MTSDIKPNTIAFVPPRFGPGVVGGAEAVMADAAFGLAQRGLPVEILTTCARDHFTWANEFPAGVTEQRSVTVRRFPAERDTPGRDRDRIGDRILSGADIPIQDQQRWLNDSLRSSGLWNHVFDHGEDYRAIIFAPYMFWTTYALSMLRPERSIIMPCLHDEPPAYLDVFSSMVEGAHGVWSLTDPERDLAQRLYRLPERRMVVGASVELPESYDPGAFRHQFDIDGDFLYYAGRREWGKGWEDLLTGYATSVEQRQGQPILPLVTSGVGEVVIPPNLEGLLDGRVIDVGLLDDQQRDNAMAAAAAYLQPSAMESFSRTVLEAMAAGTPVVANGASDVVAWHLERSGAGIVYRGQAELVQCLDFVTDEPRAAEALAMGGRAYVEMNYQIDQVLDRMVASLDAWLPEPPLGSDWPPVAKNGSVPVERQADLRLVEGSAQRSLMVTPFAPYRDGLATYALQELRRRRANGEHLEVLSPLPSAARYHQTLGGPVGMTQLLRRCREFDRVILQFGPEMLFGRCRSAADRLGVWSGLAALTRLVSLDIRLHEIEYGPLEQNPFERRLARQVFLAADRVTVHTEAEREALGRRLGDGLAVEIVDHGKDFVASIRETKSQARAELGLDPARHIFLSIGFLQYHKGFDVAIDALAALSRSWPEGKTERTAELHIVGSARVDHPDIVNYVNHLTRRTAQVSNAHLHQRFTSDVEFDRWLQAADTVVLPYREIWSSGVVERARLFGIPLVVGDLPQLRDQAPDGTLFAADTDQLARALRRRLEVANVAASQPSVRPGGPANLQLVDGGNGAGPDPVAGSPAPATQHIVQAVVAVESGKDFAPLRASQPWEVNDQAPDRSAIQRQVALRARQRALEQGGLPGAAGQGLVAGDARDLGALSSGAVESLVAIGPLTRPEPVSARPGVTTAKRVLNRLISWQIEPLANRIEELQRATTEAVAQLESVRSVDLTGQPEEQTPGLHSNPGPDSPLLSNPQNKDRV